MRTVYKNLTVGFINSRKVKKKHDEYLTSLFSRLRISRSPCAAASHANRFAFRLRVPSSRSASAVDHTSGKGARFVVGVARR